jgi:hypothetical protein
LTEQWSVGAPVSYGHISSFKILFIFVILLQLTEGIQKYRLRFGNWHNDSIIFQKLKYLIKDQRGRALHFQVPSMNRLNQTEPATFSILPCWALFRDSVSIYFCDKC